MANRGGILTLFLEAMCGLVALLERLSLDCTSPMKVILVLSSLLRVFYTSSLMASMSAGRAVEKLNFLLHYTIYVVCHFLYKSCLLEQVVV